MPDRLDMSASRLEEIPAARDIALANIDNKIERIDNLLRLLYAITIILLFLFVIELSKVIILLKSVKGVIALINSFTYDEINADVSE